MYQPLSLAEFYAYLPFIHGPTGFTAKFSLLVALLAVAGGNERPGRRLLTLILAAHFLVAFFVTGSGDNWAITLVRLMSLGLAGAAIYSTFQEDAPWRVFPERTGWKVAVLGGYALAFIYPFWGIHGFFKPVFFSLMGAVPHQTLLAGLILVSVTGRGSPRTLAWAMIAGAVILALLDIIVVGQASSLLLLAAAAFAWVRLEGVADRLASVRESAPARAASRPKEVERPLREAPEQEDDSKSRRKWDLR